MIMEDIRRTYFSAKAGALGSEKAFRRAHPQLDKRLVKQFFRDNVAVRQYYGRKNPSKVYAMRMVAYYPFERVHVDLADFRKKKRRFHYCFTAVCCFTRFVVAFAIKDKSAKTVKEAFRVLHDRIRELRPLGDLHTTFITDAGREFTNRHLKRMFQNVSDVSFHVARSSLSKAFLAERTNRTLRRKIQLLTLNQPQTGWFDHLSTALFSYNETKKDVLGGCSPVQAVHLNATFVSHMAQQRSKFSLDQNLEFMGQAAHKAGLAKGDYVRKALRLKRFAKGSEQPRIGTEIFRVVGLKLPNLSKSLAYPYYRISTLRGSKVRRLFQRHELVRVDPDSVHHPQQS